MPFMEYYISTKPLHLLRHSAHIIHLASHNIITPSLTSKPLRPSLDTTSDTFEISSAIINSALLYGSVSNIGTTDSKSGFGWIQTNPTIPGLSFKGSIIFSRPLSKLLKVKAHSNNKYNDIADDLVKQGRYISDPILINHKFFHQSSLGLINLYNNIYIVDRNIKHGLIDWDYTKKWINYNPLDSPTSEKLRNIQVDKVKKATFNYPTGNILQRNYPDLYPLGRIKCTNCNTYEDSNAHIGLCPKHRTFISSLLEKYKIKLIELIRNNNDSSFTFDIESSINASNMFKLLPDILNLALLPDEPSSNSSNLTIVPFITAKNATVIAILSNFYQTLLQN
uniref:Uncharacterized protein n=1 Tax=Rhizophagus irregularis (strain DAOM 181602 / DAOM 197198 / MUCL 43194) TaxID=747089 RepID=U9T2V6_RHIID